MNIKSKKWAELLKQEFSSDYFKNIQKTLDEKRINTEIYPTPQNIFNAYEKTPFEKVKVVILGQDPYHGEGQAHGLSFSVQQNVKIPPSLRNIYKELSNDLSVKPPLSGDLVNWAKQGVFLLNSTLTVEKDKPNSHAKIGWNKFTNKTLQILNEKKENLVFFLWGAYAQKKGSLLNKEKHFILESPHPSPLSCYRGFFHGRYFSKANEYLKKHHIKTIDWV